MSERAMSERVRIARIKRYVEAEEEIEAREAARRAAAENAFPDDGYRFYEGPRIEHRWDRERLAMNGDL